MKIAVVAGGTGGHIYPAITLAEKLKERSHEVVFFGSNDRMEKTLVPQYGFEFIGMDIKTTAGGIIDKAKSLISLIDGYFKSRKLLKGFDMVIGFGNYISYPLVMAGSHLGLKTAIHEQNSFAGKANRALDSHVDLVIGCYEENLKQFKNPHTLILGNPQSGKAISAENDPEVIRSFGLDPDKKTLVIFMGSLGSKSVNETLLKYFDLCDGSYQIIYAAGKAYYEEAKKAVDKDYIRIEERIDGAKVMKNSDLLLCRAGATTLCEIAAMGMPSIIIPSPYVPNNHQFYNAKALTDKNAAVMIEEKDLTAEKLYDKVNELINDDEKLKELSENAGKLSNPKVLDDIVEALEKL
ncbi:MAG: undecaprenyldiphospho-muramoylpentapeptide beta-N-acetylglucosaminyltransferase [Erysipelotrichaceae bacterium]|nr:undecaprenyldiphospho-muramoylpentapeptide beta-N-acetylglucosaminyltransferase [Erysipelotrichaceae bacterium]